MRILFLLHLMGVGGVERQILLLADHLTRRGHHVSVAALNSIDTDWKEFLDPGPVEVQIFSTSVPRGSLFSALRMIQHALKLRKTVKRDRIRLVVSNQGIISNLTAWFAISFLPDSAVVWVVRSTGFGDRGGQRDWKKAWLSFWHRRVSATVPLSIACAQSANARLVKGGLRIRKNVVIYDGIDVHRFRPDPQARAHIRAGWSVPENQKLIGLVGRLDPVKDHPTFLKAAAILAREEKDVSFICVGDGPLPYKSQLVQMSQELELLGRVSWPGARNDMPSVYNALDILCLSSLSEAFPNVIGEAMACGVPCVVTDVGDAAFMVGDLGVVVPPGDPHLLADGVEEMLGGLDRFPAHLLRERIAKNFSVEIMVEATENALLEIYQSAASPTRESESGK